MNPVQGILAIYVGLSMLLISVPSMALADGGVDIAQVNKDPDAGVQSVVLNVKTNVPLPEADNVTEIGKGIISAARAGKWALMVGFVIMLLTWLTNAVLRRKIPTAVMPWIAVALSVIGQGSFTLASGAGWLDAALGGLSMGLVAAGSWSAVGKYIPGLAPPAPVVDKPKG